MQAFSERQRQATSNTLATAMASDPGIPVTALHDACYAADLDKISALLESSADINGLDSRGFTPLMVACEKDDRKVVEFLLSKGADNKGIASSEKSPVSIAIEHGNTDMITLLFDNGLRVDERTTQPVVVHRVMAIVHLTPLGQAAIKGDEAVVELILKRKADVNARQGKLGWTPLHHAIYRRHKAVIRLLLEHGANMDLKDTIGNIPLNSHGQVAPADLIFLRKVLEYWTSRRMYSDSAELLAKNEAEFKKELKRIFQQVNSKPRDGQVGHMGSQYIHQQPAMISVNQANIQAANQSPANYGPTATQLQPAGGSFGYANIQAANQPQANYWPTATQLQPAGGSFSYANIQAANQPQTNYEPTAAQLQPAVRGLDYANTQATFNSPAYMVATQSQPVATAGNIPNTTAKQKIIVSSVIGQGDSSAKV